MKERKKRDPTVGAFPVGEPWYLKLKDETRKRRSVSLGDKDADEWHTAAGQSFYCSADVLERPTGRLWTSWRAARLYVESLNFISRRCLS